MDTQSGDARKSRLKTWELAHKEALTLLQPIKQSLQQFTDKHIMHVPYLANSIIELEKAIQEQKERLDSIAKDEKKTVEVGDFVIDIDGDDVQDYLVCCITQTKYGLYFPNKYDGLAYESKTGYKLSRKALYYKEEKE